MKSFNWIKINNARYANSIWEKVKKKINKL